MVHDRLSSLLLLRPVYSTSSYTVRIPLDRMIENDLLRPEFQIASQNFRIAVSSKTEFQNRSFARLLRRHTRCVHLTDNIPRI